MNNFYQVIINVVAKKNDTFQLLYTLKPKTSFIPNKIISNTFKGTNKFQKVKFNFPQDLIPYNYRIDVGSNREQKSLKIKSISFRFKENEVYIPRHLIPKFFKQNEYISFNEKENTYNLSTKKNNNILKYDPFFICTPELVTILKELHVK